MKLECLMSYAIEPALQLLPAKMDSKPARVMLIAIALQESKAQHRRQLPNGPANGYWQFERGGGVAGVLKHASVARTAAAFCKRLDIDPSPQPIYAALQYHDLLAAGFARMLLWTLPKALPTLPGVGWAQYLDAWRPGRPHPSTWTRCWNRAVALVGPE